jgi:class 3 adenylate cyclase
MDGTAAATPWPGAATADNSHPPTSPDVSGTTPEAVRRAYDAERRQLTVLFCDLVGSTMLSGQLDPEDLRAVVRAYQETAAGVIQRYEGHIAQYLGDGLLVYFGYPQAHEDDAQRAVHTGVELVETIGALNTHLETSSGVQLAVRLGIHTGPVVVGDIGGGGRHEQLALGETPNIAARLEALAAPNTVVISPVTARLVRQTFVLEDLGASALKGVAEPMAVWRVLGRRTPSRHDETTPTRTPFLVGRDEELGLLRRRWEQSKEGLGQVVLLSGAAGLGKSSLVAALRAQVGREGYARLTLRCSPYHTNSALYPVIEHLQQVLQFERTDPPETKLARLEQGLQTCHLPREEVVPLYQRGRPPRARYMFKHALIQDAAYASLLRSTRQQVHQQVAQLLETRFPEIVETQPELVARHYTAAGCHEQAVPYWQRAGQQASDRSANLEAISHLTTGIELLKTLLETPEHTQQALTLHIALGAALQMAKGHTAPEVEHAYTQARALCQQVGESPEFIKVLFGLWRFYVARPQLHTA